MQEIQAIAEDEFIVKFPENRQLSGRDTAKGARQVIDSLLDDTEVNLILTLGTITSRDVFQRSTLTKPVIAPVVISSIIPDSDNDNKTGRKNSANLAYIHSMFHMDVEIATMQKLVSFKKMVLLIDKRSVTEIPEIGESVAKLASDHDMNITVVATGSSATETLTAIPKDTEAVMVGPLSQMSDEETELLFKGLAQREVPGYSIWSRKQVEQGLLASDIPADMLENLARRAAVIVQDILLGEDPATIDTSFIRGKELTINMETARAVDVYPSLAIMTGADILHEQPKNIKRKLTLHQAVAEALEVNLDLAAAGLKVEAGLHSVTEARSPLLPQIGIATSARSIDDDRAALAGGTSPEHAWTGTVGGSQQIYSEKSWAAYTVEQHKQTGREMELDTVRLDIIQQTSVAYLNVLRAKTIEKLQKDNLKLTQANLKRARLRVSIGVAGPDEVYRWETKFASDRQQVLQKESGTLDAMEALNRILDRPLQELFVAEETDLNDPLLMISDQLFFKLMNNPKYFREFRNFSLQEAILNRPEIKAFDAAIAAQKRLKVSSKRSFWLPEFTVEGSVDQYFTDGGNGQRADSRTELDDTDWQIGVFARLPLYEGGRKGGTLGRINEDLARLRINQQAYTNRVAQDMLSALNNTRASYPAISLSREAADAAGRNLTLISDSYIEGIKSIIELLDAQNQALTSDQAAANAVYNFLIDLMGAQRALGEFVTFLPEAERKEWLRRAEEFCQVD